MAEKAARSVSTCALPNRLSETRTGLFFRSVVAELGIITIKPALACGSISYANVNRTFYCASTFYFYVCHDLKTYARSNQTPALSSFDPGFLFSISRKKYFPRPNSIYATNCSIFGPLLCQRSNLILVAFIFQWGVKFY